MTLFDEVMELGTKPIPRGTVFVRTYRRSLRHHAANVAHALWLLLVASFLAALAVAVVASLAWWAYETLMVTP